MMTRILAAAFCLAAGAAAADHLELTSPEQGASLHEGGIDMAVYYVEQDDHLEVVATYAPRRDPYEPSRFRLALADGDAVNVVLPGEPGMTFGFSRTAGTVHVHAEPVDGAVTQAMLD